MVAAAERVQSYTPVGSARELIRARDPEVLAVGPAGTGKTLAICWKLHLAAHRYPKARILMGRQFLESLKPAALQTYTSAVAPERTGVRYYGGSKARPASFNYPNGSTVEITGLDDVEKVKSAEYDMIYVNEATEISETTWQTLKSRLRNGRMPYQQIIADCNPAGPRHWLKRRCESGTTRMIVSTHRDNPLYWDTARHDWTDLGRAYVVDNLGKLTGVARKRLLEGVWAAAEGLVYDEFTWDGNVRPTVDRIRHTDTTAPDLPPPVDVAYWPTVLGVDVGSRNPTAILTAHVSSLDHIHISREVYRTGMSSADIVDAIDGEARRVDPDMIYMDPSAKSLIEDVKRLGWSVTGADNNVLVGIQRVHAAFQSGLTIDPACDNTIDEFGMYAYPEKHRVDLDKPAKEHDHAMDALRYLVAGVLVERGADETDAVIDDSASWFR